MSIMPKQFRGFTSTDSNDSKWNVFDGVGDVAAVSLGIQAPPNTVFQINNGDNIYIGATGIYELNLQQGLGTITSLTILNAKEGDGAGADIILIDVLYEASNDNLEKVNQIQEVKQA